MPAASSLAPPALFHDTILTQSEYISITSNRYLICQKQNCFSQPLFHTPLIFTLCCIWSNNSELPAQTVINRKLQELQGTAIPATTKTPFHMGPFSTN